MTLKIRGLASKIHNFKAQFKNKIRLSNYLMNIISRIMLLEVILPTV